MGVVPSIRWIKILALCAWALVLSSCNSLAVFTTPPLPQSLDKISSVEINETGRLEINWITKPNAPASTYQVYLEEVDKNDASLQFTAAALTSAPLTSEDTTIDATLSPRKKGSLVSATTELKYIFPDILQTNRRYLLQVVEKGRKIATGPEKVLLLEVSFDGFAATSAIATSDSVRLIMSNIVGLWHLNETTTGTVTGPKDFADNSGQLNHGSVTGTVTMGTVGRFNKAATMAAGSINVGTSSSLSFGTNAFTISMWVKTRSTSVQLIGSKSSATANGVDVYLDSTGKIVFGLGCSGGAAADCAIAESTKTYNDNTWHHILVMNDKTYNVLKIFVDGSVVTIAKVSGYGTCAVIQNASTELKFDACPAQSGDRTGAAFLIGAFDGNVTPFTGSIDEVAIWKRSMNNGEVLETYRRGANRLLLQVRSCSTAACTSVAFKGPDGSKKTFFSELNINTVPNAGTGTVKTIAPSITFSDFPSAGVGTGRYFQYQYFMESDDISTTACGYSGNGPCSPELKSLSVTAGTLYPVSTPSIVNNTPIPFYTLASASETASCASGVKYQVSLNGAAFFYYDGSNWVASDGSYAQSSTSSQINSGASSVATALGRTSLYVKALLNSSGASQCTLDAFGVTGNSSY